MSIASWWETADFEYVMSIASARQAEAFQLRREGLKPRQIAVEMGVNERNVYAYLSDLRGKLGSKGIAPDRDLDHPTVEGHSIKRVSTYYKGEDFNQWVIQEPDKAHAEVAAKAALEAFMEDLPRAERQLAFQPGPSDLLNQYIITDFHFGMLAWGEETRDSDWNLKIAEETLISWFREQILTVPNAETAIFAQIGDFLHWDGLDSVTPASGHVLDADTRFAKLVRVAVRSIRTIVEMLLQKHEYVHLVMAEGNHDQASSVWLREMLNVFYENEPRVTVDTSPDPYYGYQHGDVGLYYHHGHKKNMKELDRVLARKFREMFGSTKFSYAHTGHYHFDKLESNLMKIEQHETLAAADAYASRGGWISDRTSKVITYHKNYGEVARSVMSPDMLNVPSLEEQ